MTALTPGVIVPHEVEQRRALLCFATNVGTDNYGQGDSKILEMTGADLALLNSGRAPLLDGHLHQLTAVLGVVETAWIEGGSAWCIARFASHTAALDAWGMVRDRIVTNVSMGFSYLSGQQDADGAERISTWRPFEVSLCAVPKSWTAGVLPQPQAEAMEAVVDAAEAAQRRRVADQVKQLQTQEKRRWAETISPTVAQRLGTDPALTAEVIAEASAV
ncbi:HK97 family phage prohead protease [Roseomonas populi]|uniref:HK97 family phage prohead protease n=1 Tax=Roseomonas populi TaxID=3121582 RepID=A0ABT1WXS2_9PROT|nr:hypothetical protein [Roseomonas pecuniae]MCR0980635.1 hypothetical protein [Roseomonas pecuniae]